MNEKALEEEIVRKGKVAIRLTPTDIDDQIASEHYGRASDIFPDIFPGTLVSEAMKCLTICVLTLKNGYTIVGKSACASPENYDGEIGANIARDDARRQIWALEGYLLRSKLSGG